MFEKLRRFKFLGGALFVLLVLVAIPITLGQLKKIQESRSGAAAPPISILLEPRTKSIVVGESLDVSVKLDTNQNDVTAVDITFTYDRNVLEYGGPPSTCTSDCPPPSSFIPSTTFTTILNHVPSAGSIRYVGVNPSGNAITGAAINLGTFKFKGKAAGTSTLGFSKIHVNAVGSAGAVTFDSDRTAAGSYTVTAAGGGNIKDVKGTYKHVGTCTSGCPVGQKATHYIMITEENMTTGAFSGKGFYEAVPTFIWTVTGNTTGNALTYRLVGPENYIVNGTGTINAAGGADGTLTSNRNEGATWQWTKQTACIEKPACLDANPKCDIPDPSGGWCAGGLVGMWRMDETSGTTVSDSSGRQNNGTATGTTIVDGKLSKARKFSGVATDYVSVPDSTTLKLGKQQTVAAWVKWDGGGGDWKRIVGKGDASNRNYGLWLYPTAAGGWLYQIYSAAGYCNVQDLVVPNTEWNFIVGTYDGTNAKLYRNGQLVKTEACTVTPPTNNDPLTFGYANAGTQAPYHAPFNGTVDDVRVYNKALTLAEIKDLYDFAIQPAINLSIELPGIGNGPAADGLNNNPKNPSRDINVRLVPQGGGSTIALTGTAVYDPSTSRYNARIVLPNSFTPGIYAVKARLSGTLLRNLGAYNLSAGFQVPAGNIVFGDVDSDNIISLPDYNRFVNCYNTQQPSLGLGDCKSSDFNDDGIIDELDQNTLYRGFSERQGD